MSARESRRIREERSEGRPLGIRCGEGGRRGHFRLTRWKGEQGGEGDFIRRWWVNKPAHLTTWHERERQNKITCFLTNKSGHATHRDVRTL